MTYDNPINRLISMWPLSVHKGVPIFPQTESMLTLSTKDLSVDNTFQS